VRRILVAFAVLGFVPSHLAAQAVLVVITGIGGEDRYGERFHTWAATLMDAAGSRFGLPDSNIVYLAAEPDRDPIRAGAQSTKENIEATLTALAARMPADETLFVVLVGHGSYRNGISKVNLPGRDMTAQDFAVALEAFGERPLAFINLTSASGGFVEVLSGPNRTIITATKSGMERNESVFGQFFVSAFVGNDADLDNDDRLSLLEAFSYARTEVERAYDSDQKLLTEHAVLDDNGDGTGSAQPGIDADDGSMAATMMLNAASSGTMAGLASTDPELARLYQDKATLEQGVADLRRQKESLSKEDYENQLEGLLVELALANRAIRSHETETTSQ
jgi:hypothetical protein